MCVWMRTEGMELAASIFGISFHVMNWHDGVKCIRQIHFLLIAFTHSSHHRYPFFFLAVDSHRTWKRFSPFAHRPKAEHWSAEKYGIKLRGEKWNDWKRKEIVIFYFMATTLPPNASLSDSNSRVSSIPIGISQHSHAYEMHSPIR